MKKAMAVLTLLLAASLALPAGGQRSGWFIEGLAGIAFLNPVDLNARLDAQQRRNDFLYRQNYEYQQRTSGGSFSFAMEEPEDSGLRGLRDGFPLGLRVGRTFASRIALLAGIEFLGRQRSTFLEQKFTLNDLRPDQVFPAGTTLVETGFPRYFLQARAWTPQLGVIVDLLRRHPWQAGARLSAGPMFASLRLLELQHYRMSEADGYWLEWQQAYDMRGKGIGIAVDAAARLTLALSTRLTLLAEGGYALRRATRFSGPGAYEYQYRDANAAQEPQRLGWERADWRTREAALTRQWGSLSYTVSGNDLADDPDAGRFCLDLSGLALAVGLSWRL